MNPFLSNPRWTLPQSALNVSYQALAEDGHRSREGIALWAGREVVGEPGLVRVTHVILLRGPGIRKSFAQISISAELLNDVTDDLVIAGENIYLVGQIHGHPPTSTVDLSPTDIMYGIQTPDYLSVVAPNFGINRDPNIEECGVHVFEPGTGFRRMARSEVGHRVLVDTTGRVEVRVVGEETSPFLNLSAGARHHD